MAEPTCSASSSRAKTMRVSRLAQAEHCLRHRGTRLADHRVYIPILDPTALLHDDGTLVNHDPALDAAAFLPLRPTFAEGLGPVAQVQRETPSGLLVTRAMMVDLLMH